MKMEGRAEIQVSFSVSAQFHDRLQNGTYK